MRAANAEPVLKVRGLDVELVSGGRHEPIVRGVDLDLYPGEIVGLVGESGSGKSMTGSALLGMIPCPPARVHANQICLDGRELKGLDEAGWRGVRGCGIAMIFQDPMSSLDPVFTVGYQLQRLFKRHRQMREKESRAASLDALNRVGLNGPAAFSCYPHQMSGGMRQRIVVAMAMACQPRVLIADEPTTALDVTTQGQVLGLITNLAGEMGSAVLLITHDLAVVAQTCDRALVMQAGQVVESAPVIQLFEQPAHEYTASLLAALPRLGPQPVPGR